MVPSRSRNTAGRKTFASGKAFAPKTRAFHAISGRQRNAGGFEDALDRDARHTTMVDGAFAEKTGTAIDGLANQGELRGHGSSALGIRGAEYADNRNSSRAGDMHGP